MTETLKTKAVTPELLAPAGSPEALDAAAGEGADAVYLGLKSFNARMRSANFTYAQFEGALRGLHRMGRKLYVAVNTVFEQREADRIYQLLKYLSCLGPDGLIVQDFGVIRMVRDNFPALKLHASTQMNIASARAANLLSSQGLSRAVLARELSFEEIRGIRSQTNLELEVFVHGALCVSASGLCLFSSYLGGKSANRGMCTQACRRYYNQGGQNRLGGYYFSPSDLQLLERIPALSDLGINSFKIEGRMKSAGYTGAVVSAYRRVLDGLSGNLEKALLEARAILQGDFARKKTVFYFDGPSTDWLDAENDGGTGIPLGKLLKTKGSGDSRLGLIPGPPGGALRPCRGDSARFHRVRDTERKTHKISAVEDAEDGNIWISIPQGSGPGDSVYLIQTRSSFKRYPPVILRETGCLRQPSGCLRQPGREKAPRQPELPPPKKAGKAAFPAGVYAAVSQVEDLFILQSIRPVRVILRLNKKNAGWMLQSSPPPPFSPEEIIPALDPWFPQADERELKETIDALLEKGFRQFMVNNLGHFSLFRQTAGLKTAGLKTAGLIAGPYLYQYNRWAQAFVSSLGAAAAVSPPENNRQNLEKTIVPGRRAAIFITLFSYPALFRIRAGLDSFYGFGEFQDSLNEGFRLISNDAADAACGGASGGSLVIPEKPFSIVDKAPFLKEAGFRRFILDFSGPPLRKKDYRAIMSAFEEGRPLPGTSRFNWKDGFYQDAPLKS
ncbi:MAG: U32 family peptidase [Treponema sp.]|jgi:putative protease|nr:U32 family peptidase [Treponema sp.]